MYWYARTIITITVTANMPSAVEMRLIREPAGPRATL
jgi:hypothetical protein